MDPICWKVPDVIDAHSHYRGDEPIQHYLSNLAMVNHARAVILTWRGKGDYDGGDTIFRFARDFKESAHFGRFYIYGSVLHDLHKIAAGDGRDFPRQIQRLRREGFDGLKMMEGSPYFKTWLPHPLDHEYFRPLWEAAKETGIPITLHLANPADCWDGDSPQSRAMYRDAEPQEEYFRQAEAVLAAHPRLRITFAHFMFLAPQLDRLDRLFSTYPHMSVDLAMGQDYMYFLSADVARSRAFFIKWADRIFYGTDVSDRNSTRLARAKADQVRLFLETDQVFVSQTSLAQDQPPYVGPTGKAELHGLNLPIEVLRKILRENTERLLGTTPRRLA